VIVNDGKLQLLGFEIPSLETCYWGLFVNNWTVTSATVLADLTEAAWTGYAQVLVGTLAAPSLVSNVAVTTPVTNPTFVNSSGVSQGFYGWFLVDPSQSILIAAVNLGSSTIPNGGIFPLAPSITDNQA